MKNQSHTLRLSRVVVRAKTRRAQRALLRLVRDADLPCRRLFLDYRGLRLLAVWCADAPLRFRLELLRTVDRLPVPNKTVVHESRFFPVLERWLGADAPDAPDDDGRYCPRGPGAPRRPARVSRPPCSFRRAAGGPARPPAAGRRVGGRGQGQRRRLGESSRARQTASREVVQSKGVC